ncbi:hypothetical protein IC235_06330 [Hymenobacter sp. BT664]|uniref:T9SS type A sorting domain-containing protein n=1 Tax=Hymenobacter montanus TaxID=2771359 RepID=A0A927BCF0_9BACT|nr:hypothetical protein [Hymenobacter montanus]
MKKIALISLLSLGYSSTFGAVFTIPNGDVTALITAISTANTNGQADIINLAANGSYTLTAVNYTSAVLNSTGYEGERGLPNINNDVAGLDLTINGNGATIQRGSAAPNFGLFSCQGQTVFNNLIFRNGNVNAQGAAIFVQSKGHLEVNSCSFYNNTSLLNSEGGGGAIYTKSLSVLTVRDSYFENNSAINTGGAISNLLSNMTILNCSFKNNRTTSLTGGVGGTIYEDGARGDNGFTIIRNSIFEGSSTVGDGGALFLQMYNNESSEVTGCTFRANSARLGGALWYEGAGSNGVSDPEYPLNKIPENTTLLFNSCVFDGNTATQFGGAVWLSKCILNEIHSCTFKNNTANYGGAIDLITNRPFTFRNSTFNNNRAYNAAAIGAAVSAKLTVYNCTFEGNIADAYGGAITVPHNSTPVDIINCVFANNQATSTANGQGGAIYSGPSTPNNTVMIKNNIFFNQTVGNPWNVWKHCSCELNDGGNNIFFPENAGGRCVATPGNSLFVDPLLSPLANNGGPTQTMALRAGSPAIDAGGSSCPATDQRGLVRVGACDIGAYEFSAPLPVELTAFSVTASAGVAQLRWRTASETANAGFAVEVSSDGRQFRRLGWVAGQGSRAHPTDYTFADPALASYAGPLVYYRLQQVDEGGTGRFSPVRSVPVSGALGLQLWPNPARQRVSVGGVGAGQAVRVYDLSGRLVLAATVPVSGPSELELPAGLPRGSYLVRAGVRAARLVLE